MALLTQEIIPGTVAVLETLPLLNNPEVERSPDDIPFRSGPFLCIQAKNGWSTWLNITTKNDKRGLRLELIPEWLLDGSETWRQGPQFVHDARKTFVGPNAAFIAAGANELPFTLHKRPRVSDMGVTAALNEAKKYNARIL